MTPELHFQFFPLQNFVPESVNQLRLITGRVYTELPSANSEGLHHAAVLSVDGHVLRLTDSALPSGWTSVNDRSQITYALKSNGDVFELESVHKGFTPFATGYGTRSQSLSIPHSAKVVSANADGFHYGNIFHPAEKIPGQNQLASEVATPFVWHRHSDWFTFSRWALDREVEQFGLRVLSWEIIAVGEHQTRDVFLGKITAVRESTGEIDTYAVLHYRYIEEVALLGHGEYCLDETYGPLSMNYGLDVVGSFRRREVRGLPQAMAFCLNPRALRLAIASKLKNVDDSCATSAQVVTDNGLIFGGTHRQSSTTGRNKGREDQLWMINTRNSDAGEVALSSLCSDLPHFKRWELVGGNSASGLIGVEYDSGYPQGFWLKRV